MPEREPRTPFSFATRAPDEETAQAYRHLGRNLSLGGVVVVLLATAAAAVYVYRPAPVLRLLEGTPLELAAPVTVVYKWRNADGTWQISDRPPPAGTPYETLEASGDITVLPLPPGLEGK